jgi:hypothetical protein
LRPPARAAKVPAANVSGFGGRYKTTASQEIERQPHSDGQHPNQLAVARQADTDVKMTSQVLRTLEAKGPDRARG